MKHLYFFSVCIFTTFLSFSQTYKVDDKKIYSWDTNANPAAWNHEITEQYEYANGGIKETRILGLQQPSMEETYQTIKTYDGNNNIILSEQQFWNDATMQWFGSAKTVYTYYNMSNNLKDETLQNYNFLTMQYANVAKVLYTYEGSDLKTQIEQTWDEGMNTWVNDEQLELSYSGGFPVQGIFSEWNSGSGMWEVDERVKRTYTMNNLPAEDLFETWNGSGWDNSEKTTYTYLGGLETGQLTQTWNGSDWDDSDRVTSEYTNGNRTLLSYDTYNSGTTQWVPEYKEENTFSVASPLSIDTFNRDRIQIFPNPVSTVINIKSTNPIHSIEIFNLLGQKVISAEGVNTLSVEHLKSGTYLLRVYLDNKSMNRKIVIQ